MKKNLPITLGIISLALFLLTAYLVISNHILPINLSIQSLLSNPSQFSVSFFKFYTMLFSPTFLSILSLIVIGILYKYNHKKKSVFLLSSIAFSLVLTEIVSVIMKNPRPINNLIQVSGYGFPSGHTTAAFAFIVSLLIAFHPQLKSKKYSSILLLISIILIILAAFARLLLNVHWFSDILGSIFISTFAISLAYLITRHLKN